MNKLSYLVIIILCVSQKTFSQDKAIDSLVQVLKLSQNDSILLYNLREVTYAYGNRNKKKHLEYIQQGINFSRKVRDKAYEGDFVSELGYYYRKNDQLDSAFITYKSAQNIFLDVKDSIRYFYVEYDLGNIKRDQGDYETALKNFIKAISFYEKKNTQIAVKNLLIGRFNMANIYTTIKENKNAITAYQQIINTSAAQKDRGLLGVSYLNMISLFITENKLDSALLYVNKVEKMKPSPRTLAHLYKSIGNLYEQKKEYTNAIDYFKKSLNNFIKTEDNKGIILSYNNLGSSFIKQKKLGVAENYLIKANTLLKKTMDIKSLKGNLNLLSNLYEQKQDFKNALKYQHLTETIKDSILGIDKQKAISDIQIKYDTEKIKHEKNIIEQEKLIAQSESQKNRNLFFGSLTILGLGLLSGLLYFGQYRAKQKSNLILSELKETQKRLAIEKQYRDSELKALKSQMNPHFIFNALNSIQEFILFNQKDLASDYLGKFADLIRNYLHYSDIGMISIQEEANNLNLYLELEKLRFEDNLFYSIDIGDDVNSDVWYLPTMIIQPYVENALKHGLLHIKTNRQLTIKMLKLSDSLIECQVIDNGIGRAKSKIINEKTQFTHRSFALKATTKRLELLNFGKDRKIGVKFIDLIDEKGKPNGTKVILKIPISKKY